MGNIPAGVRLAGKQGPIPIPDEFTLSRVNGNRYTIGYRGLQKDVLGKLPLLVRATDIQYQADRDSPLATIKATFSSPQDGTAEQAQENLGLSFNRQTLSIFKNSSFASIPDGRAAFIRGKVEKLAPAETETPSAFDARVTAAQVGLSANEINAMNLLLRQSDGFTFFQPVLVYTRTVSPDFPSQLVVTTIGKVWTFAALANYLNSHVLLMTIANLGGNIAAPPNTNLGWLHDARLDWNAMGSAQMVETWEYGAWESASYALA